MTYKYKVPIAIAVAFIWAIILGQIFSPLSTEEELLLPVSVVAMGVMFWNYLRLVEKFFAGEVIFIHGKFIPVDS